MEEDCYGKNDALVNLPNVRGSPTRMMQSIYVVF